jgi:hypothetical protein
MNNKAITNQVIAEIKNTHNKIVRAVPSSSIGSDSQIDRLLLTVPVIDGYCGEYTVIIHNLTTPVTQRVANRICNEVAK